MGTINNRMLLCYYYDPQDCLYYDPLRISATVERMQGMVRISPHDMTVWVPARTHCEFETLYRYLRRLPSEDRDPDQYLEW